MRACVGVCVSNDQNQVMQINTSKSDTANGPNRDREREGDNPLTFLAVSYNTQVKSVMKSSSSSEPKLASQTHQRLVLRVSGSVNNRRKNVHSRTTL